MSFCLQPHTGSQHIRLSEVRNSQAFVPIITIYMTKNNMNFRDFVYIIAAKSGVVKEKCKKALMKESDI